MRFRHCTAYHLAGIQDLRLDPWTPLVRLPLAEIDARFAEWVSTFRLDGLELSVTVTADQRSFAELDTRMAIGNRLLDGLRLTEENPASASQSAEDIRTERTASLVPGLWLVIHVDGDHQVPDIVFTDIDERFDASFQGVSEPTTVSSLNSYGAHDIHRRLIGMVGLAAQHPIRSKRIGHAWWYIRDDERPHFLMRLTMSARGTVSTPLRRDAPDAFERLLIAGQRDPRLTSAMIAYGQSLESDLDPNLEFLAAFTALELFTKAETGAPNRPASAARTGLAKRFETVAIANQHDCDKFDSLYNIRNGMAHESRFNADAAHAARELFEKYLAGSRFQGK